MIRGATEADAEVISEIEQSCFGEDAVSIDLIRADLDAAHRRLTVCELDGRPVGYLSQSIAGETADLERVAVLPAERQRGLATSLIRECLASVTAQGATRLLLEVDEQNVPARTLYASFGMVEISTRTDYPRQGATSIVMQRELT